MLRTPKREAWHRQPPSRTASWCSNPEPYPLSLIPQPCLAAWSFHFCWAYPGAGQPDLPDYSKVSFSSTQWRCAQTNWPPKLLPAGLLPCSLPRTKFLTKDKEGTWEEFRLTSCWGTGPCLHFAKSHCRRWQLGVHGDLVTGSCSALSMGKPPA